MCRLRSERLRRMAIRRRRRSGTHGVTSSKALAQEIASRVVDAVGRRRATHAWKATALSRGTTRVHADAMNGVGICRP